MGRPAEYRLRRQTRRVLARGLYGALALYLTPAVVKELVEGCGHRYRERFFPPQAVLWGMISQALSRNCSDRATVHLLAAWSGCDPSPRSGSYCKARQRLPLELLEAATQYIARITRRYELPLGKRRIFVLDGSTVTLADTPENQEPYPQPSAQKQGCGFPVLKFVTLMDHATGCIVGMEFGSLNTHEVRLAQPLLDQLQKDDILLVDRGFGGYALLAKMAALGVDVVVRQHKGRQNKEPLRNEGGDTVECWQRPTKKADCWDIEWSSTPLWASSATPPRPSSICIALAGGWRPCSAISRPPSGSMRPTPKLPQLPSPESGPTPRPTTSCAVSSSKSPSPTTSTVTS